MINHSFVVMAYKDSPYLSECLDSLKNQSVRSKIYISTSTPSDYISNTAKKYGIEVIETEAGHGIAHDWNFSLQLAKTKYVTLAHQDDLYLPEYAEICFTTAEKYDDTLICFTGYSEIVNGKIRSDAFILKVKSFMLWFFMPIRKDIRNKFWKKNLLSIGCPIAAPSVMYNIEKLIDFQFANEFSVNMDWDAWHRIAGIDGRFVYVDKKLMIHRIHSDSATTKGLEANLRKQEDLIMFKRFWPVFFAKLIAKFYEISYKSNHSTKN
jgi:glycosyltransferase involved in cell wall biosynthesis